MKKNTSDPDPDPRISIRINPPPEDDHLASSTPPPLLLSKRGEEGWKGRKKERKEERKGKKKGERRVEGTSARPSPGYTPRVSCLAHPPPTPGQALGHVVGGGDRLQKRPSCLPSRICRDVRAICARACTFTRRGGPVSPCVSARARARDRETRRRRRRRRWGGYALCRPLRSLLTRFANRSLPLLLLFLFLLFLFVSYLSQFSSIPFFLQRRRVEI